MPSIESSGPNHEKQDVFTVVFTAKKGHTKNTHTIGKYKDKWSYLLQRTSERERHAEREPGVEREREVQLFNPAY